MDIDYNQRLLNLHALGDRIIDLALMNEGWLGNGEGKFITLSATSNAKYLLTQLILDYPNLPTPRVYPTPEGGLQAEWTFKNTWAVEVEFHPSGVISDFVATNVVTGEDRNYEIGFAPLHAISRNMQYFLQSF